jgi:NTE family protein
VVIEMKSDEQKTQAKSLRRLNKDKPLSIVLGGGGVRGMAHVGLLESLIERDFRIAEMVGTSVGALIISFYAAVGLSLSEMRELGLNLTSRHLLAWAWLRRAPRWVQQRFENHAGLIPTSLRRLAETSGRRLHHGVERIGLLCYDRSTQSEVVFTNIQEQFPLEDATRGSAAIPGLFPPRRCVVDGRQMSLVDGGVINCLPAEKLFEPPFTPKQILVVDVSNNSRQREITKHKVEVIEERHPEIPIVVVSPDTIGSGTVMYRRADLQRLIDAGRAAILEALPD